MEIHEEIRDQVAVLTLSGALLSGPEVAGFHEHVKKLMDEGVVRMVVDFSSVNWFGSAMLGVLSASVTSLWNVGGDMRLTGVGEQIESIMRVTRLIEIFKVLGSVDEAVASFQSVPSRD